MPKKVNKINPSVVTIPVQAAWKIKEWMAATRFSHSYVYELIAANKIRSAKIGGARRILTDPFDFIARHEEGKATKALNHQSGEVLDLAI